MQRDGARAVKPEAVFVQQQTGPVVFAVL